MGIPVLSPERLSEIKDKLNGFDLGIVVAYGLIIPKKIIALFPKGIINLHPSLLPKYRGASPIQWALLNGEEETGISIIYLTEELDSGDIIVQRKVKILPEDNAETLSARLSIIGADVLEEAIRLIEEDRVNPIPQNSVGIPTYAPKIEPQMGRIDWDTEVKAIVNKVRAFFPWPKAYFYWKGIKISVLESEASSIIGEPGRVIDIKEKGILIGSKGGSVWIKKVQPENRRAMSGLDFANGYRIKVGDLVTDG